VPSQFEGEPRRHLKDGSNSHYVNRVPAKHPLSPFTLPFRILNRKGALAPQEGHFTSPDPFSSLFFGNSTLVPHTVHVLVLFGTFPPFLLRTILEPIPKIDQIRVNPPGALN